MKLFSLGTDHFDPFDGQLLAVMFMPRERYMAFQFPICIFRKRWYRADNQDAWVYGLTVLRLCVRAWMSGFVPRAWASLYFQPIGKPEEMVPGIAFLGMARKLGQDSEGQTRGHKAQGPGITMATAKTVFRKMADSGKDARAIVDEENLWKITDSNAISAVAEKVINGNPREAERYASGRKHLINFFVGQAMKETNGRIDPNAMREEIEKKLRGRVHPIKE